MILAAIVQRLLADEIRFWPQVENAYHDYIRSAAVENLAEILQKYEWVWLYGKHGFVIGDNPLCRWQSRTNKFNMGLKKSGVEITFPLSVSLSLKMEQRHWNHNGQLMACSKEDTRRYNCRQRYAAIKHVCGGTKEALDFINRPVIL